MPALNSPTLTRRRFTIHEADGALQVIDVGAPSEWKSGHVPGARHIFLPELREKAAELNRTAPIAAYCDSGYRAACRERLEAGRLHECQQRARQLAGMEEGGLANRWKDGISAAFHRMVCGGAAVSFVVLWPALAWAIEPALDARNYPGPAWSPYIVGAGIGVLSWLTFYFSDRPIGASSFYATVAGLLGKVVAPRHTEQLDYFKNNPPVMNREFAFILAAVAGATVTDLTAANLPTNGCPHVASASRRHLGVKSGICIVGGGLMAFGARLAGGCTSGHGISGTLQLTVASWIAVVCFFIGGAVVANLLFRM